MKPKNDAVYCSIAYPLSAQLNEPSERLMSSMRGADVAVLSIEKANLTASGEVKFIVPVPLELTV